MLEVSHTDNVDTSTYIYIHTDKSTFLYKICQKTIITDKGFRKTNVFNLS